MIIQTTNLEKAKREIKIAQAPIVIQAQNEEFNRKILEHGNFQILLSPEATAGKNKIRQTDSGLNHVLAKIAARNKVAIGIDLREISKLEKKEKADRLAKIRQNIKICRKAKTKLAVSGATNQEAGNLLQSLGASTQQIKEAIVF
ncbi:MAG: hypothetical protein AABY16_03165 [Nanoarchaeota archaeon]